jgi:hypothetical protein
MPAGFDFGRIEDLIGWGRCRPSRITATRDQRLIPPCPVCPVVTNIYANTPLPFGCRRPLRAGGVDNDPVQAEPAFRDR